MKYKFVLMVETDEDIEVQEFAQDIADAIVNESKSDIAAIQIFDKNMNNMIDCKFS